MGPSRVTLPDSSDCPELWRATTEIATPDTPEKEEEEERRTTRRRGGGILFPAVAEEFDSTLTSGKVLSLRGKALKETITNDRRKRFWGFCAQHFSFKKMRFGPRQGT